MTTALLVSGVLQNLGIAAVAALFYDIVLRSCPTPSARHTLVALVFAAGAVGSMTLPVEVAPGIIFDLRNAFVILAMSFGGWLAVGATTLAAFAYRLWLGGAGALPGGVGIVMCAAAGIVFALHFKGRRTGLFAFAVLGVFCAASLVSMFLLPFETAVAILMKVGPVMLVMNILGTMIVGGIVDRQKRQFERENTLTREASTDSLTRLANRRAFDMRGPDLMEAASQRGDACALMLIDIDHFKQINDAHGHDVGDKVLQHLAVLVRSNVRKTDLVARYGGEEIALVLPSHDAKRAFGLGERLRKAVAGTPYRHEGTLEINLSVSIGLYASDGVEDVEPFATAFKRADMALYRAKEAGRNRVEIALAA
ncbi:diguanylate cyclase [Nitratireductor sp. L1-7-SE]|uniref:diguanylate cyclase n=1 Tax=Nitratireductor rhodophyticola TaxID=2854036 RepID=A0ABS7R7G5_9HYPH|nr:diguanylate cyclase [Nitratireductor rhodophyticola]MBY8916878.1 diguanylate cyclase [Nitratireductor rhodophyticola]MBY8920693.1 diguanylate cyclase [Nitratireductor rhodophyticola]MEC9246504.1 diguanylate cyclase [Pseudomonadota bacterium]